MIVVLLSGAPLTSNFDPTMTLLLSCSSPFTTPSSFVEWVVVHFYWCDSFAIMKMNHSEYLHVLPSHIFRSSVSLMLPSPSMISLMFIYSCRLHFWVATNGFSIIHNTIHHSFCILHMDMASISIYTSELGFFWVMTKSNFLHFITTLLT